MSKDSTNIGEDDALAKIAKAKQEIGSHTPMPEVTPFNSPEVGFSDSAINREFNAIPDPANVIPDPESRFFMLAPPPPKQNWLMRNKKKSAIMAAATIIAAGVYLHEPFRDAAKNTATTVGTTLIDLGQQAHKYLKSVGSDNVFAPKKP